MTDAIVLTRVSKTFPQAAQPTLHETSLSIAAGRLLTILGRSGCGKTTLLRLINRLTEPSSGRILIHGEDTAGVPPAQLRRHIGYVIQQGGLFPHMTVAENIATVPRLLGWKKPRIAGRVEELLSLVNLDPALYAARHPRELSGGQQQRVGLARALAAEPPILLMDEPFGALDAITRSAMQEELRRIHRQLGTTIVFVTHDIQEALSLGEVVVVMDAGRVLQQASPSDVLYHPADDTVRSLVESDARQWCPRCLQATGRSGGSGEGINGAREAFSRSREATGRHGEASA